MNTTHESPATGPAMRGVRALPATARTTAVALLLAACAGTWQACGAARSDTANVGQATSAPRLFESSPLLPPGTVLPIDGSDELAAFWRTIREPATTANGPDLPAHELILGITLEDDARGGEGVVKTLILDLGDLSVRAVDLGAR